MNALTKMPEKIKKGLECCSRNDKCHECPYYGEDWCSVTKNDDALALVQQLERDKAWAGENSDLMREENKRLEAENERLKYTLTGVMHFVDKWLDVSMYDVEADKNGQDAISRADEARKTALEAIEELQADNAQLNRCIENMTDKLNAAHDEGAQLKTERDAAVKDCSRFMCETCAEKDNGDNCSWCAVVNGCRNGYVWRGVQKED